MVYEFKFPDLGEGIVEGEIRKWLVKQGETVEQDQPLAEVETDKAVVELPSPQPGTILKLHRKEGSIIKVGEVLATIGEKGEVVPTTTEKKSSIVGELPEPEEEPSEIARIAEQAKILATPAVRGLAKELSIDISSIKGSGPQGRVTEEDVRSAASTPEPAAPTKRRIAPKFDLYGYVERVPVRGVRRVTAKRMMESQTKAAHVTAMEIADVTELYDIREKLKISFKDNDKPKITYLPFIIKAVVEALKQSPLLNSTYSEESEEIIIKKYYNIGFAVATEEGLLVPVIKGADLKNIKELADEIQKLTELASSRKIDLADLNGGTFTITNYGVFGGTYGTPIINYPEVAILGTGRIMDAPMVKDGEIKIRKALHLSLSFDHRVLDGAEAARFMNTLKSKLENPVTLLV